MLPRQAPTAIRALMRFGDEPVAKCDLSSLRVLGEREKRELSRRGEGDGRKDAAVQAEVEKGVGRECRREGEGGNRLTMW